MTPQDIGAPFEPVLTSAEGVLSAVAQLESGVWYAAPRGALAQGD